MSTNPFILDFDQCIYQHNHFEFVYDICDNIGQFKFKDNLLYYKGLTFIHDTKACFCILEVQYDFSEV